LLDAVAMADRDFRDVLSYAEYPRYFRDIDPTEKDEAKRKAAIEADWQDYSAWLQKR
jgi:hypothetical protein